MNKEKKSDFKFSNEALRVVNSKSKGHDLQVVGEGGGCEWEEGGERKESPQRAGKVMMRLQQGTKCDSCLFWSLRGNGRWRKVAPI